MKVNGKTEPQTKTESLLDYLTRRSYQIDRIAVEYNGEIIPKEQYASVILSEADTLEIVSFVGGG